MDNFPNNPPPSDPGGDRPPIWFGVIGQHGIWPVTYNSAPRESGDAGRDFIFQPRRGDLDKPIGHPGPKANRAEMNRWAEQFIPLIPQFTWIWGTLVLLACATAWVALLVHWQVALRRCRPGGFADLFRPYARETNVETAERSVGISRELYTCGMLAALAIIHCSFVLRPCRLTLRHSPWWLFHPPGYFHELPWGDRWNWFFGFVAILMGGSSFVALIGAIAIRYYLTATGHDTTPVPTRMLLNPKSWSGTLRLIVLPLPLTVGVVTLALGVFLDPPIHQQSLMVRALDSVILAGASWAIGLVLGREIQEEKARAQAELEATQSSARQVGWKWTWNSVWAVLLIPPLAGVVILAVEIALTAPEAPYDSLLFLERAVNLGNGVSPEMPVLLLGLAAGAWLLCQLRRVDLIDRLKNPEGTTMRLALDTAPACAMARARKQRLIDKVRATDKLLSAFLPPMHTRAGPLILLGLTLVFVVRLYERFVPTIDGLAYNRWMILAFSGLVVSVVFTLGRFLMAWASSREVLREIARLPMQRAFKEVPESLSRNFGPYLNALRPRLHDLEIPVRQWGVANEFHDREEAIKDDIARGLLAKPLEALDSVERNQFEQWARAIRGPQEWADEHRARPDDRPGDRILRAF